MLILTRKIGEAVMIGNDVKITVLHVKGSQIRLGIDAPSSVSVHREEIFSKIQSSHLTQAISIVPNVPINTGDLASHLSSDFVNAELASSNSL